MLPMWPDGGNDESEMRDVSGGSPSAKRKARKKSPRLKIGKHVERSHRKRTREEIKAIFDEHFGDTRETAPLIDAMTDYCLQISKSVTKAQKRQVKLFYDFLALIEREISFFKSGKRR